MTEETRDPKVSASYRELGAEEPPRGLDEAILAASRRAASAHPAPLVAPTGRRAWFVPLAAAAVLVLAVSLTLHMQFEQKGGEGVSVPAERAKEVVSAPQQKAAESQPPEREQAPTAPRAEAPARSVAEAGAPKALQRREPMPFTEDSAAQRSKREAVPESEVAKREASVAASAPAPAAVAPAAPAAARPALERSSAETLAKRADAVAETPEKELERIARLRSEGRHEEADKALAEFRKRYPEFQIPAPMLERVERR
jgi:hypothetical protein